MKRLRCACIFHPVQAGGSLYIGYGVGWTVLSCLKAFGDAVLTIDSDIVPRFLFAHYLNVSKGT